VIAVTDPNQSDSVDHLTAHGVSVDTGVCAAEATHLHGGFLSRITAKRPRFTGKWAMTLDGCLAAHTGASGWISSPEALALSRRRRRAFDAILIGGGTAKADDPQLLASRPRRHGAGHGPLRIVVASAADLDDESRLLHSLDQAPLLVVHGVCADPARLRAWGAETQALDDPHDVGQLARMLGGWGLNDVLVEGGATLHGEFLRAGLYDRLEVYQGATTLGGGMPIARGQGVPAIPDGQHWRPETAPRLLGTTVLSRWTRA
jgi:diaminohydroxyphosphoribosylaminopyrimidine deaminase/5-amino-6-(5-phosphoribosylamino)uracil reductase